MRTPNLMLAGALVLGACAQPAPAPTAAATVDTAAVVAAVTNVRTTYNKAEMAGDAAAVAALYTPDGAIDIYGAPPMRGAEAIQAALTQLWAAGKPELAEATPLNTNARSNSDASEIGTYHNILPVNGKRTHEWGRYVVALAKDASGTWKLTYLMAFADSTRAEK